jgi:hypothetical protein
MNWECFFETYCTLSGEYNNPLGCRKEYSIREPTTIYWKYDGETLFEDEGIYLDVTFIEHLIQEARCKDRGPIHTLSIICVDGSQYNHEMHGDTAYDGIEVTVDEMVKENIQKNGGDKMNDVEKATREYLRATDVYYDKKVELEQKYANYKRGLEVKLREQLQLEASDKINIQNRQITIDKYATTLNDKQIRLLTQLPDNYSIMICANKIIIDISSGQIREEISEEVNKEQESTTFKIQEITTDTITFTNNKKITYYHEQDCCEHVYADFDQIDSLAYDYTFTEPLIFEEVEDFGFRFGNPGIMVGIPCYNEQNGYYSSELTILYDGDPVIKDCGMIDRID